MKTIIAENTQKDSIYQKLTNENGIVNDVQILSLSSSLKEEVDDSIVFSMLLSNALLARKEEFPIYAKMFNYPAFIQEILQFSKECIYYNIQVDDLPETNQNEEELKRILAISLTLDFSEKRNVARKDKQIQALKENKDTLLYYSFYTDAYHYDIYQQLLSTMPSKKYPKNTPAVSLRYALNARSEAEAVVQDICKKNQPCTIILTDTTSQLPLYESVLSRYHVPFSSLRKVSQLHFPLILSCLIMLGIHKDRESLLNALRYNAFEKHCPPNTYAFFQNTLTSIEMPKDLSNLTNDVFQNEIRKYNQLYEEAYAFYTSISADLEALCNAKTMQEILYTAFSIARKSTYLTQNAEMTSAISIRKTLISSMPYIQTKENLIFLANAIKNVHANTQILDSTFCTITDLTHPIDPTQTSYVVSTSGSTFPGVPKKTGLFDETYVEKIHAYPTQAKRYDLYMKQLQWIENSAEKELIYSYYTNDYQGREVQLAFEIENQYKPITTKWELVSLPPQKKKEHTLPEEIAHALFEEHGKVTGSISTIERYFACPYSYFIRSGLHVRKKDDASLDSKYIGTIQHAVLENSFHQFGKQYATVTKDDIRTSIEETFQTLDALSPTKVAFHQLTKERMIHSLWDAFQFLQDFEKHTSFIPTQVEYPFHEDISEHVTLHGIIDRLDTHTPDMLRIIDFKSSQYSLSENMVKAGQQLQLLSYLIVAKRIFQLDPAGAYYFSLKNASYDVPAKKVVKKDVIETDWNLESEHTRMINARRLKGWTFTDRYTELDDNQEHITSVDREKEFTNVEDCILTLYETFYEELIQGNISLDPTENACNFCEYKSICRFHGIKRKIKPIASKDIDFAKKKKEE